MCLGIDSIMVIMVKQRIAITGAAGNLGNLLAYGLQKKDVKLNLLIHNKKISDDLSSQQNVYIFKTDLADENSLFEALKDVKCCNQATSQKNYPHKLSSCRRRNLSR